MIKSRIRCFIAINNNEENIRPDILEKVCLCKKQTNKNLSELTRRIH